jgi:hypothetical protein
MAKKDVSQRRRDVNTKRPALSQRLEIAATLRFACRSEIVHANELFKGHSFSLHQT